MKHESNNAIDLMLRKLGRSDGRSQENAGNGAAQSNHAHLDADELSAYAENALPVTTRARYTEHLADCARCRQIVSQLRQAAGFVVDDSPKTLPISGIKAFLASLLSPVVLRYAVPALGLLVVASIGFFVLRQRGMEVAQQRAVAVYDQTTPTAKPGVAGATPSIAPSVNFSSSSEPKRVSTQEVAKSVDGKVAEPATPAEGARRQEKEQPVEKPVTSADQVAAAAPVGTPAETVAVASAKPSAVADQKQEVAENKVQTQSAETGSAQRAKANDEPAPRRAAKEPAVDLGRLSAASGLKKGKTASSNEATKADDAEEKRERDRADKDKAEMVSIAGRHFRKSGSLWIDVAYNSSQATTNVTRGSEQYRALIADEPGIRTIAEQLKGEVIVVWKGHVYRIR